MFHSHPRGGGCSSGSGKEPNPSISATLTLSSDKTSILADGQDKAVLSAFYSGTQEDVTAKAELYADDQPLSTSEFTSNTPGKYTITAVYNGITSNSITITAVSGETADGITLKASKTSIYSDGGDFAVLTLTDAEGTDVTAQGTFYANGEELESNRFSSTVSSYTPVTITAKYNGNNVAGEVKIIATTGYEFTSRLLLEDITKTDCPYCPNAIRLIEEIRKNSQTLVVPYSVHNEDSDIYKGTYSDATREFAKAFCTFMGTTTTAAPKVYLNRKKENVNAQYITASQLETQALNGSKDVAIALESSLSGSTIPVKVTVGSKKNFSGKIVVVLVENGIYAEQGYVGYIEMYRIMRGYAPSVEGEPKQFSAGVATTYTATFDRTKTTVSDPDNCEVIAFVTDDTDDLCENVQCAKIGEIKTY